MAKKSKGQQSKVSQPNNASLSAETETALQRSEDYFRALTENLMDVILVLDVNMNIKYKSASFEKAIGSSRSGEGNPYNFVHPDDLPAAAIGFDKLMQNPDEPLNIEIRGQHRDGSWRNFEVVARNLLADPVVEGIVANFRDITERRQAQEELEKAHEELETKVQERTKELKNTVDALQIEIAERKRIEDALRESEEGYSILVSNLADAVFTFKEGVVSWGNDKIEDMLGFTKEEVVGTDVNLFMPSNDTLPELYKNVSTGLKEDGSFHGITQVKRKDGSVADIEFSASIVPGKDPVELVGIARDITDRRIAFEVLHESEKRYRLLAENVTDVIWIMDTNMQFTYISPSVERLRGYNSEEAMSLKLEETVTPDTLEAGMNVFTQLLSMEDPKQDMQREGQTVEMELYCKDGSTVWTEITMNLLCDETGQPIGILGVTRDNTEHRIANETVERKSQQIIALQEITTSFQSTLELEQILERIAEAVVHHLGFDHAIMNLRDENKDVCRAELFYTIGGTKLIAEVEEAIKSSLSIVEIPTIRGYSKFMEDSLDRKQTVTTHLHNISVPPLTKEEADATQDLLGAKAVANVPIFVKDKFVGSIMAFTEEDSIKDEDIETLWMIADRAGVAIENAKLNEDLEQRVVQRTTQLQAANMELEDFAYSLAHDLRTPLRGIDGFSQVLLEDYYDSIDEQGQSHLKRVRTASQHMAVVIDDILHLLHIARAEMNFEKVDLSMVAKEIAGILRRMEPERQVEFDIEPGLAVNGDPELLREIIDNLFRNSWKFTGQQPGAKIEFGSKPIDGRTTYYVHDNGVGFDMTYINKLFKAFQRLHLPTEFDGNGIGLATVQRIINRHGGEVWAESELEKGATFYFTL